MPYLDRVLACALDKLAGALDKLHFWSLTGWVPPKYRNPVLYEEAQFHFGRHQLLDAWDPWLEPWTEGPPKA